MALSQPLIQHIEDRLYAHSGISGKITSYAPVTGGDINQAYALETTNRRYFLKLNKASAYPEMFRLEAEGLSLLGETAPGFLSHGILGNEAFLLMPWIEPGINNVRAQENLGIMLAEVHQKTAENFGLANDNYNGNLPQVNTATESWTTFYIQNRLEYQLKLASGKGLIDSKLQKDFDKLYKKLGNLYPVEQPSLIHGDLWSGNYLISKNDKPYLIDPAIYFGHREMDIAMTMLFGGFQPQFYLAYDEALPLSPGWQQRISLWQLYPLLVHVNLFGISYLPNLSNCLKQWI